MTSSDYRKLSVLLSNMKNGSRESFASVYAMYEKKVYFLFCKLLGSKALASDMTIELFDYVYLKFSSIDDPIDFEKWLYSVVFSRARQYLLTKRPEEFGDYFDTDSPAGEEVDILLVQDADEMMMHPDGIDISVDMMKTVDTILSELPLKLRVAVMLYYFCGFELADIAAAEQISLMAAKNRMMKARIRMQTEEHKYTQLGFECDGLVVFLPDILSVMAGSIVVAPEIASGVTARTGIKCVSGDIQNDLLSADDASQGSVHPSKSENFAPTKYAVVQEPKKKFADQISPSMKVIMSVVAIIIILGGAVAAMLAIKSRDEKNDITTTLANETSTTVQSVIAPTTLAPITQSVTEADSENLTEVITDAVPEAESVTEAETTAETTTEVFIEEITDDSEAEESSRYIIVDMVENDIIFDEE